VQIACLGGGPASLYFSILMKQAVPQAHITVYERNRPDDTFGWGVVFSDETLGHFRDADAPSYDAIRRQFAYWDDIDTWYRDTRIRSTGHGFCGLGRKQLLQIFHARCRELGVELRFEAEVRDLESLRRQHDLLVAADGVNSLARETWATTFQPRVRWGACRFAWLGTTRRFEAFTFVFRENEHGLWRVHAYPFDEDRSTFIVECLEETWRRAGLDRAAEEDTVAYVGALFADHLQGHGLLTNRSLWRAFPEVRCRRWHHGNVVLLGDAVHTAHFSIGSGTKLAMEGAIALAGAFRHHGAGDVPRVLAAYQEDRWVDVLKVQKAARVSQAWFEHTERYLSQEPLPFVFNLMTRSKRITWENLAARDPALVEQVAAAYADEHGLPRRADGTAPPPMFAPLRLRGLALENRIVVSPMCQYSAVNGTPGEWHLVHLGSRAIGGAGLLWAEMTNVSPEGRITPGCAGLYADDHVHAWRRITDFVHAHSAARIGLQLGHSGRKGSCHLPWEGGRPLADERAWATLGPSAVPFDEGWPAPRAMDSHDLERVRREYVAAAHRALAAGFDLLELHMAHGYLLSSFLSPVANRRDDAYGGGLEGRARFPLEVFDAVRAAWPEDRPLGVRITATDWLPEGGFTEDDAVLLARMLKERGTDFVDVSSGGNSPASEPEYGRMYQVPFAERIRHEVGVPVIAVGAILGADHANTVLAAGRADLVAMARPHLVDPYLTLRAAVRDRHDRQAWPPQYLPAKPVTEAEA
jgi:anthraniloyl-CoA monooxygenase